MFLKTVKLRGFKSFVDPVEVRFEPGIAVVVGPNGSGKSNISDAIVWATGSLSAHELRAEKPDDVLFAGSPGRAAADFCEVELVFDNESGAWPGLPYAEVSLCRRLHRGGEGQYLINRAPVRRLDLIELLSDVGLGGGLRSVISQGSVESVLGAKPGERRALVEEAAGLGRFKLRRHRAELKLARVAAQVERAAELEAEVRKRLRPLALQASAAERAAKLAQELAATEAALATHELAALEQRRVVSARERERALAERTTLEAALARLVAERVAAEEALTDTAGTREAGTAALYRLRACAERLELRREGLQTLAARLAGELEATAAAPAGTRAAGPSPAALVRAADEAARVRDDLAARARLARDRLAALERSLAEREGLPPAARTLAEAGERLALAGLEVEPGRERAVAAALGHRASALLSDDAAAALALVERARAGGLGSLVVLVGRDPRELVERLELLPLERLLAAERPSVTVEGIGYDPLARELWFAGETAEAVLLELEASRRALAAEADELAAGAAEARARAEQAEAAAAEARQQRLPPPPVRVEPALLARLLTCAERALAALPTRLAPFEAPLRARVESDTAATARLGADLRRLGAAEVEQRRSSATTFERVSALEVELARIEAEVSQARRRLEEAASEPAEGEPDELAERRERLLRRRAQLGEVNPLAKEDYQAEKERLEELSLQRADLARSLEELEQLRRELTETVEQRFAETYAAVERHFHEVAATLFPGGEGRLRLVAPAEGEEDAEPGIEVELRPAGKRVTRLSLLSGGEKALGAVAFLFSLFLARPSPFYLLDEVEAALDDTNIGRFTALLRGVADGAQFIVVTHQKRTMEAADVLYGVTMGRDGVSQVLSRRLPAEEERAASA